MSDDAPLTCLNCGRSEAERPLISIRYAGNPIWVCSACMPVLIHDHQQIAGKLKATEKDAGDS